jgi:hypothetical protein
VPAWRLAFIPEAELIVGMLNGMLSAVTGGIGIAYDSVSGALTVRSTDILFAPDLADVQNGFASASDDIVEAGDDPNANHLLIGPDVVPTSHGAVIISLTGGDASDVIIAGAGNEILIAGDGSETLVGGQGLGSLSGAAGNDTLEGGAGNERVGQEELMALSPALLRCATSATIPP